MKTRSASDKAKIAIPIFVNIPEKKDLSTLNILSNKVWYFNLESIKLNLMITKNVPNHQRRKLEKLLSHGEQLIMVTTIGSRYFWINFIFLLPLAFLIVGIPKLGKLVRMRQSFTYALSNRRFIIIRGIFSRKIVTAPLTAITHVTIEQSVLQRYLFNTGHLVIITAGFDQREIVIENIGNPVQFKIMIEELTEKIEESWQLKKEREEFSLRPLKT